jgi:phage terminase large subunit GpA-like protein
MAPKQKRAEDSAVAEVFARLGQACLPPAVVDPIQWIESTRWLSAESSREIGPFRFNRAPYLEEPQRAIIDSDTTEVVLDWCSQAGKSEILLNSLLFWSVHAPAPTLLVAPDWKSCKSLSADRLKPMMRDARLYDSRGDSDEGIEQQRGGPGSDFSAFRMTLAGRLPLTIVHASSASALAQRPIKYLLFDEVSRFPVSARGRVKEGDPVALGRIRLTTYGDSAKTVYVSSPVEEFQCRISELFEDSTRERYHSRCPLCGHLQVLLLADMNFETASCKCLKCGQAFDQDAWQSEPGQWIAENPGHKRRGFWLNFAVSPFVRWTSVITEFREACHRREEGDESLFRVVLATRLTQNYTEKIERMSEPEVLLSRREVYPSPVPSDSAKVIVAAIDTMDSWLEYLVVAGGVRGELWLLESGTIEGRIETDWEAMYAELDQRLFQRQWKRPDGRFMMISRCLQDSGGHSTHLVYRLCRERARVMCPYRGSHDLSGPWKWGVDSTAHQRLVQGNANYWKDTLATKLAIEVPGPGYIHFSADPAAGFDEEFFFQLLSERKERRKRIGVITTRWVQIRIRNEALDLACMTLCCLDTYRGRLETMEPLVVSTNEKQPVIQWGAQKKTLMGSDAGAGLGLGGVTGFGTESDRPRRPGFGALPGSGVGF